MGRPTPQDIRYIDDDSEHYLLEERRPPPELVALRTELQFHPEITAEAIKGDTFEECLGIIAAKLDVALDGQYDVPPLAALLTDLLRGKRLGHARSYTLRKHGLVASELVETAEGIRLEEHKTTVLKETDEVMVTDDVVKPKLQS